MCPKRGTPFACSILEDIKISLTVFAYIPAALLTIYCSPVGKRSILAQCLCLTCAPFPAQ